MTKKEIRKMVMEGATGEYSHFIIYSDHWDYTYGCRYVKPDEDINRIIKNIKAGGSPGMFSIEEIYNYSLDLENQLDERRAYHIEPIPKKETTQPENSESIASKEHPKSEEVCAQYNYVSENLKKVIDYAISMHSGQQRHDGTPYVRHPLGVLENVLKYKKSKNLETLLISACLHDTLEDTKASYYDIVEEFGAQVASIVLELTTDEDMKNALGKEHYLAIKMKNMSSWALVIKLCDRLDNVKDLLIESDEHFKDKYVNETIGILDYLLKSRKLSKTHLTIIEQLILLLFQLCSGDITKIPVIAQLSQRCTTLKDSANNGSIFSDLLNTASKLDENSTGVTPKKLLY